MFFHNCKYFKTCFLGVVFGGAKANDRADSQTNTCRSCALLWNSAYKKKISVNICFC